MYVTPCLHYERLSILMINLKGLTVFQSCHSLLTLLLYAFYFIERSERIMALPPCVVFVCHRAFLIYFNGEAMLYFLIFKRLHQFLYCQRQFQITPS